MITPFDENYELDEEGLRENIRSQIEGGIDRIVPVGTTGECATLSHEEHKRVVEIAIDTAGGEVPVIAGTGSNSTREALRLTRHAAEAGADAAMLVTPYYNKPTQRGLYEHYKKIAQEVDIPQIIYNVPSRTGRNIDPETLVSLSEFENIVGVKEAIGDLQQIMYLVENTGEDFNVLSGDDHLTLPMLSLGAVGVISVASNIVPGEISKLVHSYLEGDTKTAMEQHYEFLPLFRSLFLETNPGPVKAAMGILDRPAGKPRLPLVEVTEETKNQLREVLSNLAITPE
ncbi:hypothetical protein AKJ40_00110 [candidate division MSBL1 archaeon SCGC-AAA259M10]|uniref:4-hydroxy-tetrahydrodipicolinate synthase n=1 Tax=candidate division MSBL1 archaeon SCGC-AAA259M10 TaxID=1698270 RepID=A0A133V349_9EURY|nr:hypothetical protein AKJ40_00110 [candidate division MSBL1 archaeon SCGC-AAA259M10]